MIEGKGLTAKLFKENGIEVYNEKDYLKSLKEDIEKASLEECFQWGLFVLYVYQKHQSKVFIFVHYSVIIKILGFSFWEKA